MKKWIIFLSCLCLLCLSSLPVDAAPQQHPKNKKHISQHLIVKGTDADRGLFSMFCTVITALNRYDIGHLKGLEIDLDKGYYLDSKEGPNWWNYYFEPIELGKITIPHHRKRILSHKASAQFAHHCVYKMDRERCHELIQKYVKPKPHIEDKLKNFVEQHFQDFYMIGIHYRGTDKIGQGGGIRFSTVFDAIQKEIDNVPAEFMNYYKIFVATDEKRFLDAIQKRFTCPIVYIDCLRSEDGKALHKSNKTSNYQKGEDAVLDCLLLSRCNTLLRMDSNLCYCAGLFNPVMPITFLK